MKTITWLKFFAHPYSLIFYSGCLSTLAFAPFSLHGFVILSLAILAYHAAAASPKKSAILGMFFGLGYFGSGVSWVIISIHDYGGLNYFLAGIFTLLFITYLSLYTTLAATLFSWTNRCLPIALMPLNFACVWVIAEWLRNHLFTGFPWLSLGYSQLDTPLEHLIPVIGNYGLSFSVALLAALLALSMRLTGGKRYLPVVLIVLSYLLSYLFATDWTDLSTKPIKTSIIQANSTMHKQWDKRLFDRLLNHYQHSTQELVESTDLIVWPESAIPIAYERLIYWLTPLAELALKNHTALLIGVPRSYHQNYFNSMFGMGEAQGHYDKRHLVPFGEYVPGSHLTQLFQRLGIPLPELNPGKKKQTLLHINQLPIASLICYEVAFTELLRQQLPQAQLIVSISDDGWFGHSLAMSQHLEMARFNSLLTGRYQIVANNNGLSAIIDTKGKIRAQLAAFVDDTLVSTVYPAKQATPWVKVGDMGVMIGIGFLVFVLLIIGLYRFYLQKTNKTIADSDKRSYPKQP